MENKMDTALSRDIEYSEVKIRFDAACRGVLSDKHVLAWILKGTLAEYKEKSINEIINCIEQPEVGTVAVENTNAPERIVGMSDTDKSLYEGNIFYDIRFSASVKDTQSTLIINIEEQNDFYPGYPLLKRAVYYCGRMISAQNGSVFSNKEYGKLRKVVSIWICPNPPKHLEYSAARYDMREEELIGKPTRPVSEYDLISVIMIYLGNPADREENDFLKLLSVLLSTEIEPKEKKGILEDNFKIPMTTKLDKEVLAMCNLSDGIEQRGIMKGIEKGIEKGKSEMILKMLQANHPIKVISEISDFSETKIKNIAKKHNIRLV